MNQEWSELNKVFQSKISKKTSFKEGVDVLFQLRKSLLDMVVMAQNGFPEQGYSLQPLPNSKGYDCKTMAYSLFHIARIEDIVCHELIAHDEQVFHKNGYQEKMNSSIATTGNELQGEELVEFSKSLSIPVLYDYFKDVYEASNKVIESLSYEDLKKQITDSDKEALLGKHSVSTDPNAIWLVEYWCGKDILGLLKMPFSRHWIMHIEAFLRIKNTIIKNEKKKASKQL